MKNDGSRASRASNTQSRTRTKGSQIINPNPIPIVDSDPFVCHRLDLTSDYDDDIRTDELICSYNNYSDGELSDEWKSGESTDNQDLDQSSVLLTCPHCHASVGAYTKVTLTRNTFMTKLAILLFLFGFATFGFGWYMMIVALCVPGFCSAKHTCPDCRTVIGKFKT
ncbi:unnamed protein product [Bursaphelenchus okinawaensis]|uniref:LITAF domain-containing protein n=1 Tax=Bursaphelenchus okinawaensis TaxID=465554 RepID=A0A811LDK2_9BILA|nr:unnamed protein product [Bursaphelenchus okinawaensis]CAG9121939.1 unnamed protein product [Bursaphelenchus okinawaensis]